MNTIERMREKLSMLMPTLLEIDDDSAQHAGHAGARDGGGHYTLRIASAQFSGKSTLARHRMIYGALAELMRREIHALSIDARAPHEQLDLPAAAR